MLIGQTNLVISSIKTPFPGGSKLCQIGIENQPALSYFPGVQRSACGLVCSETVFLLHGDSCL